MKVTSIQHFKTGFSPREILMGPGVVTPTNFIGKVYNRFESNAITSRHHNFTKLKEKKEYCFYCVLSSIRTIVNQLFVGQFQIPIYLNLKAILKTKTSALSGLTNSKVKVALSVILGKCGLV